MTSPLESHPFGCGCDICHAEEHSSLCSGCKEPIRADEVRASRGERALRCDDCALIWYAAKNAAKRSKCALCGDRAVAIVNGPKCDRCLVVPETAEGAAA